MGDMILKQKPPFPPHRWQSSDMLSTRSGFPPFYPQINPKRNSYPFRPPEPAAFWRDIPPHFRPPGFSYPPKVRDYHMLPSFYRNVMPPPPNPNRLLMMDPRRWATSIPRSDGVVSPNQPPCHCNVQNAPNGVVAVPNQKSRSMEDVREFVIDWEQDHNGNNVSPRVKGRLEGRRSMENLLDGNRVSPQGAKIRQRIMGRRNGGVYYGQQVCLFSLLFWLINLTKQKSIKLVKVQFYW